WVNPPVGEFGVANSHYNDFRMARRPSESMSLARNFRFTERTNLMIRAEFSNIFNRAGINVPVATNAFATQTRDNRGQTTAGYGYISPAAVGGAASNPAAASTASFATPRPREGTLVVRFTF